MKRKRIIFFCLVLLVAIGSVFLTREIYIKLETAKVLAIANEYSQVRLEFREFLLCNEKLTYEEIASEWGKYTHKMKKYLDDSSALPVEMKGNVKSKIS